jgi:hypothetical protein
LDWFNRICMILSIYRKRMIRFNGYLI